MQIFKNFFDEDTINSLKFYLAKTNFVTDCTGYISEPGQSIFQGFIQESFPINQNHNVSHTMLNTFAITAVIKLQRLINKNFELKRVLFNILTKDVEGVEHIDIDQDDYYTFILNLEKCDGGTFILKKFFKNNYNEGLFFKSNILHRGIGPKKNLKRINMALMIKERK
jgi:hypothetical protein